MSGWEMKIITAETQRLLALAASDANLRAELRTLAEEILRATEAAPTQPQSHTPPEPQPPPALVAASSEDVLPQATQVEAPLTKEPLRALTLGQGRLAPPAIARSMGVA